MTSVILWASVWSEGMAVIVQTHSKILVNKDNEVLSATIK